MIGNRRRRSINVPEKLQVSTAKDFRGGLNTQDSPLNLATKYSTELVNLYPDTNGRLNLRCGTSTFAELSAYIDEIVNCEYFAAHIVVVGKNGKIVSVDAASDITLLWDTAIAATRPGAPAAWSSGLTFVSFTQYGGALIVCNGIDKPLVISDTLVVNYLADAGTGSNVNAPRARYCMTHNNFLILAFTPTDTTTLYICSEGTTGTFVGDPGVDNHAVNFDTSKFVARGSPDITGLSSFRDKLIVTFDESILAITLGIYNTDGDHTPSVTDTIANHGAISHRSIVPLGDDIVFQDLVGVASVQRALITATLSPTRESALITKDMQAAVRSFTPQELSDYAFAVHDRVTNQVLFLTPVTYPVTATTDNNVFVYCFDKSQRFRAWTRYTQMGFRCGCRSTEGRLFFGRGTVLYLYHNVHDPLYSDYAAPGTVTWDDSTTWDDGTNWIELYGAGTGYAIPFTWAMPWTDFRQPMYVKASKYLSHETEGLAHYAVEMYVDGFASPEMSMVFDATSTPIGAQAAYRPSNNDQLYAWPHKFTKMRIRVYGSTLAYIGFTSMTMLYAVGSIRR